MKRMVPLLFIFPYNWFHGHWATAPNCKMIMKKVCYPLLHIAQWLGSHVAILFFLWSLWLAIAYFGFGPASYVRIHDIGDSNLPARLALANHQSGYWNPQGAAGTDRLGTGFTGEADSLLYVFLPGWLAYGLFMWLQRFVAGYFTFRLLRESLGLDLGPSLFAGLSYALFAQNTINVAGFTLYDGLALPGLPFLLWSLSRLEAGQDCRQFFFAAGLGILLSITAHFSFAIFLMPVVFFWFLFVMPRLRVRFWLMLLLLVGVWLLCEMPVLWANFLNAPLSHRADWDLSAPFYGGWQGKVSLASSLARDNALALGLALGGLAFSRGRDRRLLSLSVAAVLCLGFVAGSYSVYQITSHLGLLAGFQFDRLYLVVPFLATIAGGVGLHLIPQGWRLSLTRQTAYRYGASLQILLSVIAISLVGWQSVKVQKGILSEMIRGSNFVTLYGHADLRQLAENQEQPSPFRVATVSYEPWHPAYVWAYGLESADGYLTLYPQRYQDYWGKVIAPLTSVDKGRHDYFHLWGSRIYLFLLSAGWSDDAIVRFSDYYDLELLSLANVRYIISPFPVQDDRLTLLPSQARDRQLAFANLRFRYKLLAMLRGEYPGIPLYIYENQEVLPRFFLVGRTQVFDESIQVLEALRQAGINDLRSTAYLQRADAADLPLDRLGGKDGQVILDSYSSDLISLEVSAEAGSILIVTNNYSPFWRVWVNNLEVKVFPVDHTFQGIYVDAGQHEVVLKYMPPYAVRFGW